MEVLLVVDLQRIQTSNCRGRSWTQSLVAAARDYLERAISLQPRMPRVLQARIHAAWCARRSLAEPPPWSQILALYDELLKVRDDAIVRLNRAVALAEVAEPPLRGLRASLTE